MFKRILFYGVVLILFLMTPIPFVVAQEVLRDELGEIFHVNTPGIAGEDYAKREFIASFQPGFLTLPSGLSEASLEECDVEESLRGILQYHNVTYVEQVFTGYEVDDTIRVVNEDTVIVPDLSQIYLLTQEEDSGF